MAHRIGRELALAAVLIIIGSLPAWAIPVKAPFGSDTMPKALFFTGAAKPASSSESNVLLNRFTGEVTNTTATGGNGIESGIIMTPVGDGSYVCTATVYPGASYNYYFAYRIDQWDVSGAGLDSRTTWTTWRDASEARTVSDRAISRGVTIPTTATSGYYIYNAWGDRSVIGYQAPTIGDSSVLTTANPFLAWFGGSDTIGKLNNGATDTYTRISSVSDTQFANNDANYTGNGNVYNLAATQTGANSFLVSWEYTGNGTGDFMPTVDAAEYFTNGGSGSSKRYGYRIYRSDSTGVFTDVTQTVTGDTNWSDDNTNAFDGATTFIDTSANYLVGDTVLYTVLWHNAYGYTNTNTAPQLTFASGYDTVQVGSPIRVFFIVEHYNENAVFRNGSDRGRIYLTPVIDGVRRPDLRTPAEAVRVVNHANAV